MSGRNMVSHEIREWVVTAEYSALLTGARWKARRSSGFGPFTRQGS